MTSVPEVITISDSDDDSPSASASASVKPSEAVVTTASDKVVTTTSTTATTTVATAKTIKAPVASGGGCPSVMALTPNFKASEAELTSTQSTPCASRSHATSCVTVGDSDEDASPLKTEPGTHQTATITKKTRLLKAQSEWMLSSLKEEDSPANSLQATAAPSR